MSDKIEREELDFSSDRFDALEALTSTTEEVVVPVPEAPVYDNLGQFISSVTRARAGQNVPNDGPRPGASSWGNPDTIQRRFLPHQEPVIGRGRSSYSRPLRNVLSRMDEVTDGPLSVLRRCMTEKRRIKVWIRSARWIRGWCTGFIAAFDKQWNLALTDVDETFTRKRRRKTPVYGPVELMTNAMESLGTTDAKPEEEENEELTGLVVLQLKKKDQVCQRHIQQLFIRGEQVALVSVLPV